MWNSVHSRVELHSSVESPQPHQAHAAAVGTSTTRTVCWNSVHSRVELHDARSAGSDATIQPHGSALAPSVEVAYAAEAFQTYSGAKSSKVKPSEPQHALVDELGHSGRDPKTPPELGQSLPTRSLSRVSDVPRRATVYPAATVLRVSSRTTRAHHRAARRTAMRRRVARAGRASSSCRSGWSCRTCTTSTRRRMRRSCYSIWT